MMQTGTGQGELRQGQAAGDRLEAASFGENMRTAFLMLIASAGCVGESQRPATEEQVQNALAAIEIRVRAQAESSGKGAEQVNFEVKRAVVLDIVSGAIEAERGGQFDVVGLREAIRRAEPNSALGQALQEFEPTTAIRTAMERTSGSATVSEAQKARVDGRVANGVKTPTGQGVASASQPQAASPAAADATASKGQTLGDAIKAARWVFDVPETCVDGVIDIARDTGWTIGACTIAPLVGPAPCTYMALEITKSTFLAGAQCLLEGAQGRPGVPETPSTGQVTVSTERLLRLPVSCVDGASQIARGALWTISKCTLAGAGISGDVSSCAEQAVDWTITIGKGSVVCVKEAIATTPSAGIQVPIASPKARAAGSRSQRDSRETREWDRLIRDMSTREGRESRRDHTLERAIEFKEARDRVNGREIIDA